MKFRIWLENNEYEGWKYQVEKAAYDRNFAFSSWFPTSGRIFMPFSITNDEKGYDEDVAEYLQEKGYTIKDYRQGLATNQGRVFKIGKLLEKLLDQDYKSELARYQAMGASPTKIKSELDRTQKYNLELLQTFQNSPYRTGKGQSNYSVVFSSDPHDIAAMSTGRDWTSCMQLGKGAHYKDIFCEIKNGGFIAYLIKSDDVNIQKPLARILIRRFDNKQGKSIAIPEDTVYGNEIEGFSEFVKKWVDNKQGPIGKGFYKMKGGKHSDTFSDRRYVEPPNTANEIGKLIYAYNKKGNRRYSSIHLLDAALKGFFDSNKKWGPKLIELIKETLQNDYTSYASTSYMKEFIQKYPQYVDEKLMNNLSTWQKQQMIKTNPQLLNADAYKNSIERNVLNNLDINNQDLKINKPEEQEKHGFSASASMQIKDILSELNIFDQLSEPLIRKVVKFGDDLISKYKDQAPNLLSKSRIPGREDKTPLMGIISHIIHTLAMSNADTPTAINFYKKLLPFYDRIGPTMFGNSLAKLGINGQSFLPFLKERLKNWEDDPPEIPLNVNKEYVKKEKENLKYIIDSIENGQGRSDRYEFSWLG